MRGVVILALVAGLTTSYAQAQVKKATVSKKTVSAKGVKQNFNLIAANTTVPAAVDGSVAAPVETVTQEAAPKKWGVLVDFWHEFGSQNVNQLAAGEENKNASADVYTLIRPSYKLTDETSLALGLEAAHGWGTEADGTGKFALSDPYLMVANSNLGSAGPLKTKGYARIYLPFSESSQDKGQIAMLRLNSAASLPVGPFKIAGTLEPRFMFQSDDSYRKPKKDLPREEGTITANQYARMRTLLTLSGDIAGPLSFYTTHGLQSDWYYENEDVVEQLPGQRDKFYNETMLLLAVTSNVGIGAGIFTLRDTGKDLYLYNEEDSVYVLDLNASF
jgi:hypothetical protein